MKLDPEFKEYYDSLDWNKELFEERKVFLSKQDDYRSELKKRPKFVQKAENHKREQLRLYLSYIEEKLKDEN